MSKLGVIGGSGIYDLGELRDRTSVEVDTPFGTPSSQLHLGRIGQTEVLFLARHGMGHVYSPSDVPNRANIHALKQLGATHVLSLSAVGSLREALPPRTLVIPDQIIDRTVLRERTFFDRGVVAHVGLADPFCSLFQEAIAAAAGKAGQPVERGGTYICIEGPQFSTRAESLLYRRWDAAVIGMTVMPEARLAREAELCYATLAMVTDYDVWNESEADVSVEIVLSNLQANGEAAGAIVTAVAQAGLPNRTCRCAVALDHAVVTAPIKASHEARLRTELLTARQERQD
ncbi:MAG: S-methyl-5'-thioadenosine phosphorylase [Thermomicrobiales bacterium]